MSIWQQHYYTWSTNSLSQNKVGLGIVAASLIEREAIRIGEIYGAKSEALREEPGITVERGSYSQELPGYIRTGATPCEQGADQRNNKFVHVYSQKMEKLLHPEQYLAPLTYEKQWEKDAKLSVYQVEDTLKGRKIAIKIIKKYHLEHRLEELFYQVYHCLLAGEKPLSIVDSKRKTCDFSDFSREMMMLIHYMIPIELRKDADYVSFVNDDSQEAHFLFCKDGGKHRFDLHFSGKEKEYTMLEKEFFQMLSKEFLDENSAFEKRMDSLNKILHGLLDRRNQLEKCKFACMASHAGKERNKEEFFVSMERLMYWARKDKILLPAIKEGMKDLDFHSMKEEELRSYTKLLLTGAGGETKPIVYDELNRMLQNYHDKKAETFTMLVEYIFDVNKTAYEKILQMNESGFTKGILSEPIDTKAKLNKAVKHHKSFLKDDQYKTSVVRAGYAMYQQAKSEELRQEISQLVKQADEQLFLNYKKKDVEKVLKATELLDEYLDVTDKMAIDLSEQVIVETIFNHAVSYLKMKKDVLKQEEEGLIRLGERLHYHEKMEDELLKHYQKQCIMKFDGKDLIGLFKVLLNGTQEETALYQKAKYLQLSKRYLALLKEEKNTKNLPIAEWIRFVLRLSSALEKIEKKTAKGIIQATKNSVLKTNDLYLLAKVNQILKKHGNSYIFAVKSMWDEIQIESVEEFKALYEQIPDLSLVKCEKSSNYEKAKRLYQLADSCKEGDAFSYAWTEYCKLEKKAGKQNMEEKGMKKLLHCAVEDILSKTIWAVLFGFYGFFFVTLREQLKYPIEYGFTIIILIGLILCYIAVTLLRSKKEITPGGIVYVLGMGIMLMNWAVALDTIAGVVVLFIVSLLLGVGLKIFYGSYFDVDE